MTDVEHLETVCKDFLTKEGVVAEKIKIPGEDYYSIPFLEGFNVVFAIYEIYINSDMQKAKEYFHRAALVAEHMSVKFDRRIIDSGIYPISYALLSDNQELIRRYSVLKNSINNDAGLGYQFPNAIQNVLQGDVDKLAINVRNLTRLTKVSKFKNYAPVVDVFTGFKDKSEELITRGLAELLSTNKKRNSHPLIPKFISIDTAGLAKLARREGYHIDLGSPLVPEELMPVAPLKEYPGYELLKY